MMTREVCSEYNIRFIAIDVLVISPKLSSVLLLLKRASNGDIQQQHQWQTTTTFPLI